MTYIESPGQAQRNRPERIRAAAIVAAVSAMVMAVLYYASTSIPPEFLDVVGTIIQASMLVPVIGFLLSMLVLMTKGSKLMWDVMVGYIVLLTTAMILGTIAIGIVLATYALP